MDRVGEQLARALEGDGAAVRAFVATHTPVIQARAARSLMRRGGARDRDPRQELADLVQEVFIVLFRDDGRVLRSWQPDRGLSLQNFIGLVAEREVRQIAMSGRRSPWALNPAEDDDLERNAEPVDGVEAQVASREIFDRLQARLADELHDKALELFRLLIVDEVPVPEVCALTKLSTDAVYAWRSRLLKRAREMLVEIQREPSSGSAKSPPTPGRR
ncbi:MAG: RNA polymerase sigma factor [Polyangiales bacterium]